LSTTADLKPSNSRISFAKTKHVADYPDFLDVQLDSYKRFTQWDTSPEDRDYYGLQQIFEEHFPIQDARE